MSARPNWKHYHIERNGNTVNERMQRYRRAWELVARLAKTSPARTAGGCSHARGAAMRRGRGRIAGPADRLDLEDLLFATLDAVSRFRVGQREAVGAALEAGGLLTEAKGRLQHGEWGDWVGRVGLAKRTASMWMKLSGMGLSGEQVIARGGHCPNAPGRLPQIGNGCRFGG